MSGTVVVDPALIERADLVERSVQVGWSAALRSVDGNPLDIEIGEFPGAVAVRAGHDDDPFYNRAFGVEAHESNLDAISRWFASIGVSPRIEVIPHLATEPLLRGLGELGLACTGFNSTFVASIDEGSSRPPADDREVTVSRVALEEFVETVLEVSGASFEPLMAPETEISVRHDGPDWSLYRASLAGRTCGWARMRILDGAAALCGANVAEHSRRAGAQLALLRQRVADAVAAGCDIAVAQAEPGTTSQRNMERFGLQLAYHKAVWTH
ncbi:MAG: hypothetical protein AAGD18_24560 [Actinomycetota bacterium]